MEAKFKLDQRITCHGYDEIPEGAIGTVLEIYINEVVMEEYKQPLYLVDFDGIKPLILGYPCTLILESELKEI